MICARRVHHHQPRRVPADAGADEPRGADEPGRDLRGPALLELDLGLWGAVLAVPMLMMMKAICDHIEDLQPVGGAARRMSGRLGQVRRARRRGRRARGAEAARPRSPPARRGSRRDSRRSTASCPAIACFSSSARFHSLAFQAKSKRSPSTGIAPTPASMSDVQHHAREHHLRHPQARAVPQQEQREDRRREVADAGKEPEDRIDPEGDLGAGNAERAVENPRPAPHQLESARIRRHGVSE